MLLEKENVPRKIAIFSKVKPAGAQAPLEVYVCTYAWLTFYFRAASQLTVEATVAPFR